MTSPRLPSPDSQQPYCPCGGTCHFDKSPCSMGCIAHNADVRHRVMRVLDDDATCGCGRSDDHPMHHRIEVVADV